MSPDKIGLVSVDVIHCMLATNAAQADLAKYLTYCNNPVDYSLYK